MSSSPIPRQGGGGGGPSSAVQVTYTSTGSFVDSPLCSHILSSIASQLPLRNVHHRPSAPAPGGNTTVKTIQSLPVRLVPLADEQLKAKHKPETRHLVQANLLERPFVHIFLVATADSDAYRTQIRNEIRTWINDLKETPTLSAIPKSSGPQPALPSGAGATDEDNASPIGKDKDEEASPEYLIVYVTPPAGAGGASGSSAGYFDRSPSSSSNSLPTGTGSPATPAKDEAAGTPSTSAKTGMGRFLSSSSTSSSKDPTGGVLDKLRTDFGGGKKSERIVHISRLPASSNSSLAQFADPTIFADLLTALRQSVASTFDLSIKAQRDEAVKLKSLRSVRGWNPVGVFGKIECLANTYESIGLHDEALRCFEELDDLYEDCLREGELTWFPSIAPTSLSEGEDSTSVLSPTAKPYREMILHSSASLWELKKYLLARRLMLLSKMGRGLAVMREAMAWLAEMRTMVADQDLPPHCLSAFSISVCLDIVHHCQHLFLSPSGVLTSSLPASTFDDMIKPRVTDLDRLPASFHSLSGDVLGVALDQVQKMGVGFQYLPAIEPFVSATDSAAATSKTRETTGVTRKELLKAVEDEESFDTFYTSLAERTLDALTRGGRTKSTRRIQIALASLDLHRNRIEKAHRSFSTLLESFSERTSATWPSIERLLLRRQLECHSRLGKPKNRAWVASVVSLLRSMPTHGRDGVTSADEDRSRGEDDGWSTESQLFSKLRAASMDFEKEVPVSGFGKLSLYSACPRATLLDDQDGVRLPIVIFSTLLGDLQIDDARFCLVGGGQKYQREQYWLTSGPLTLKPGKNEVWVRSTGSAPGTFVLDVSQVRLGRIVFQYVAAKTVPATSSASPNASVTPTLVRIPTDGAALDASLEQPDLIALDQPRNAHLVVRSGRNKVARAVLRVRHIADARPLMGFGAGEVVTEGEGPHVQPTEDGLGLEITNVEPWTETTIVFPLDEAPPADGSAMPLIIDVEYYTTVSGSSSSKGSSTATTKRLFRKRADLNTALPLGVNVQDFFRLDCLLCKFSISTGGGSTLKVRRADLVQQQVEGDEVEESEYSITGPPQFKNSAKAATVAVTSRQPVAYVFKIARRRAAARGSKIGSPPSSTSLRLSIVYRTLHEDAKVQLSQILATRLSQSSPLSRSTSTLLSRTLGDFADEHLDTAQYTATGSIRFRLPTHTSGDGSGAPRSAILMHWQKEIIARQWSLSATSDEGKACLDVLRDVLAAAARCGPSPAKAGAAEGEEQASSSTWRTLEIPVEVPQMDIVNCVRIVPVEGHDTSSAVKAGKKLARPAVVGQALPIEVHIESTLHWGSRRPQLDGDEPSSTAGSSLSLPSSRPTGRRRSSSPSTTGGGASHEADTDAGSVFEDAVSAAGGSDTTEKNAGGAGGATPNGAVAAAGETPSTTTATTEAASTSGGQRMHYEVQADFDSWIVSGPRRGVFHLPLTNTSSSTTSYIARTWLIPLRSGSLSMPSVAVWPLRDAPTEMPASLAHGGGGAGVAGRRGGEAEAAAQEPLPTCETYVANLAERVGVVEGRGDDGDGEDGQVLFGDEDEKGDGDRRGRMRTSRRETFFIDAAAMAV